MAAKALRGTYYLEQDRFTRYMFVGTNICVIDPDNGFGLNRATYGERTTSCGLRTTGLSQRDRCDSWNERSNNNYSNELERRDYVFVDHGTAESQVFGHNSRRYRKVVNTVRGDLIMR